jgi:MFS family permease
MQGVIGFLPTLLTAQRGFGSAVANGAFALLYLISLVGRPMAGRLSDRVPRLYVGGGGLLVASLGILGLVLGTSIPVAVAGVIVFTLGRMAYPPSVQAYLMDVFPDEHMGGDLGATRTVYLGLGSLGPTYVGFVASQWNYALAFAGFVPCLLVGGTIMLGLSGERTGDR